jgi:hypothetical protein
VTGYFSLASHTLNINAPTGGPYHVTVNVLDIHSGATGNIQLAVTMNWYFSQAE